MVNNLFIQLKLPNVYKHLKLYYCVRIIVELPDSQTFPHPDQFLDYPTFSSDPGITTR